MTDQDLRLLSDKLEREYRRIYTERMQDMPMVNPSIGIHAIGFHRWQGHVLGILITPWCMNLLCLPGADEDWSDQPDLRKVIHQFPSGNYEFINSTSGDTGKFQMCSLFSPMFEFASDAVAVETAEIILRELQNPQHQQQEISARPNEEVRRVETAMPRGVGDDIAQRPLLSERLQQPISRRRLLRGALQLDGDES